MRSSSRNFPTIAREPGGREPSGLREQNNREGLERLCNYGVSGPLSLERLSAHPDGPLAYRMKRPSSSGETVLVLRPISVAL